MTALLIIAHAPLATCLKAVAGHAFADAAAGIGAIDVTADMTQEQVEDLAIAWRRASADPDVLVLTDVFGATPSNAAQKLVDGLHVRVLTGVNVPMIWRALCYRHEPLDQLAARAMAGASQGIMQVTITRPQNQATPPTRHDSRHIDDQQ